MRRAIARRTSAEDWVKILRALADPTRLGIIRELLASKRSVNEIAERLEITQYNASKHLRVLRRARIVAAQKQGARVNCGLTPEFCSDLAAKNGELDLGCCVFRFDRLRA